MQVYLKHNVTQLDIVIDTGKFTDADTPYNLQEVGVNGDEQAIAILMREIPDQAGIFGHQVQIEAMTNADLIAVAGKLPNFSVIKILDAPKLTKLPEGTVS